MADKKQEISVPFSWEEVPGTPKKNWKIPTKTTASINEPPPPPPIKLLLPPPPAAAKSSVSIIPFKWEEKPGTPLRFFSQEQHHHQSSSSGFSEDESQESHETSPVFPEFSDSDDDCCYESGEGLIKWLFPVTLSNDSRRYMENESKVFDEKKRPLLTLGELMVMSQRRSYQKKIMDMHSKSFTKGTNKRKAYLCCIHGFLDIIWNKQKLLKLM